MKYIIEFKGRYYFKRRVPEFMREFDCRTVVKMALKTDSKTIASKKAAILNAQLERYWDDLLVRGATYEERKFKQAFRIVQQHGFHFATTAQIATDNVTQIQARVMLANPEAPKVMEAILGAVTLPEMKLNALLDKFWLYAQERIIDKSEAQIQKWKNPRIKAVKNFITLVGNKELKKISRDDIVSFRDWWIERIKKENKNPSSANKDLIHLKNILETVSDNLKLDLDIAFLFKKIMFKNNIEQSRLPLSSNQIESILNSELLKTLKEDARWFLFAASETGARPVELVGMLPEDIQLDVEIPHIKIVDRKDKRLKTPHSQRDIPLVGYALEAFKACPKGFTRYLDRSDSLTTYLNKFLRDKKLLPSEKHSVYSLRHSFQDRILSVNAPDRIQAELMGHKFKRPKYGDGGSLAHKKAWMDKICLKEMNNTTT